MTLLTIYNAQAVVQQRLTARADIVQHLHNIGIEFSFCAQTNTVLAPDATDAEILHAHNNTIDALKQQYGYQAVDVVRMHPTHPDKQTLRQKFLAEHVHNDDEVRLFTEGSGLFTIHINDMIYALVCTAGDLIRLPAGIKHWFDMGSQPLFTAVRLFTSPDGWVGHFTGDDIALRFPAYDTPIQAIITDIEGTTSSIDFVHNVLFPYAREHLTDYVTTNAAALDDIFTQVQQIVGTALTLPQIIDQLHDWLNRDQKITPLKALQGLIWAKGYADGVLKSDVYPDAAAALRRWHQQGLPLYVYSSGSVAAQKLLFQHTHNGDMTPLFSGYYDTTVGAKTALMSYVDIAQDLALSPPSILFLSDHLGEINAAKAAGMQTIHINRTANCAAPSLNTFDDVCL